MSNEMDFSDSFWEKRRQLDPSSILALFSALGDVYFFMKDTEGRFIGANELQLEKLGLESEQDVIGKTDFDFFPSYMIAHYAKDDAHVIKTGNPILRRVELVANPDGSVSWHITSKFPLYDSCQKCVGIIGVMRDFDRSNNAWQPYRRMNAVVDYISDHYAEAIEIVDLANIASLSVSQFERRFRTVFQQTPSRFLIRYRLTRASQILMQSEDTLSCIAQEVGFYDHSHFSREFQKLFGMAPSRYRKAHRAR
ncbi:AraC family transcriptional regulator [Rubellicoccus peritrichatus]|uniref:AraC family transcriptional regulator n=1 Tax=Rubellicoccus peritrichatus TaxID=3080537 RepID=A0AAQ3L510_9BACT|nr:AraC family transcriptional regulator [Puniceicoccus sp. CR14]WOO39260.1 AraC family transcriptional regulator [Puniceicoccus sp. CR14]